jgi:hypothetical protein
MNAVSVSHLRRLASLHDYSQPLRAGLFFCRAYGAEKWEVRGACGDAAGTNCNCDAGTGGGGDQRTRCMCRTYGAWPLFMIISQPLRAGLFFCRAYGAEETRSRKSRAFAKTLPFFVTASRVDSFGIHGKADRGLSLRLGGASAGTACCAPTKRSSDQSDGASQEFAVGAASSAPTESWYGEAGRADPRRQSGDWRSRETPFGRRAGIVVARGEVSYNHCA